MNHLDRINLIKNGIPSQSRIWAEFGSGSGAFTLALAELIDADGIIYSVDSDNRALIRQKKEIQQQFPNFKVHYITADFTKPLDLPPLDGILMANALHYIQDKESFLSGIKNYLKPEGRFLIVEYNIDHGNHWVPYPISFKSWGSLAAKCSFVTRLLGAVPSRYHREIYCAAAKTQD